MVRAVGATGGNTFLTISGSKLRTGCLACGKRVPKTSLLLQAIVLGPRDGHHTRCHTEFVGYPTKIQDSPRGQKFRISSLVGTQMNPGFNTESLIVRNILLDSLHQDKRGRICARRVLDIINTCSILQSQKQKASVKPTSSQNSAGGTAQCLNHAFSLPILPRFVRS